MLILELASEEKIWLAYLIRRQGHALNGVIWIFQWFQPKNCNNEKTEFKIDYHYAF